MTTLCKATPMIPRSTAAQANGDPQDLVRTFVKRLRRKLGDAAGNPAYIFNERGVWYRMAAPGNPQPPSRSG